MCLAEPSGKPRSPPAHRQLNDRGFLRLAFDENGYNLTKLIKVSMGVMCECIRKRFLSDYSVIQQKYIPTHRGVV